MVNPRTLLVADLDDTLTGDAAALTRFQSWCDAHPDVAFVVATGRDLESALRAMARAGLRSPAVMITSVGTEIHWPAPAPPQASDEDRSAAWHADMAWAKRLAGQWQPARCAEALRDCDVLVPQPADCQKPHKLSYTTAIGRVVIERIRDRLEPLGLAAQIVYSHGGLVDVIAPEGGKGSAALYVAAELSIAAERVVAAGNSGNDIDLLQRAARGIAVGNADADLQTLRDHRSVYFATAEYADGIVEGLAYWPSHGAMPEMESASTAHDG